MDEKPNPYNAPDRIVSVTPLAVPSLVRRIASAALMTFGAIITLVTLWVLPDAIGMLSEDRPGEMPRFLAAVFLIPTFGQLIIGITMIMTAVQIRRGKW